MFNLTFQPIKESFTNIPYGLLLEALILLIIGVLSVRLIRFLALKLIMKKSALQNQMLMGKLINYTGFFIVLIIILAQLGIKLSALLGAAGILGIAIGVASQKSLGNIISGFFMVTEKSFEIGDAITVGDKTGIVYSIELLSIMLKTFDNVLIRIPHETLISTNIVNITRFPIRRMDLFITVSYKSEMNQVMEILGNVARNNAFCLDEPNPFILIKEFQDSGILIQYGIWFEKNDYVLVRNAILSDVLEAFRAEGITIPYPHITIENGFPIPGDKGTTGMIP